MAEDRPWLFDDIPALHAETQVYTSRRRNAESPKEYKYSLTTLVNFLINNFGLIRKYGSEYASDAQAGSAGVPVGGAYELSIDNIYAMPAGVLKIRKS